MTRVMLNRYFRFKKGRLLLIFLSVIIGSASVASLSSVYLDIDIKMRKELRTYGANLVARKFSDSSKGLSSINRLSEKDIAVLNDSINNKHVVASAPYLYGIAEYDDGRFAIVGADLNQFKKLSPYIRTVSSIKGEIDDSAIIGKSLAGSLGLRPGDKITLTNSLDAKQKLARTVTAVIESGDDLDDQLVTDLNSVARFMGLPNEADYLALSYVGSAEGLESIKKELSSKTRDIKITPVNKISRSEATFLGKISALTLFITLAILISAILATAITLASMIFERRYEIGIKKALGASNKDIIVEMGGESLLTGAVGGIIGWIAGIGIAQIIGITVFNSYISVRPVTVIVTIFAALAIGGIASIFPLRAVLKIEPAHVLRNE